MLSSHSIIICSLRGMLTLQKCLLEDFYKSQGWDRSICHIQPYLNVYAFKKPLVYQYGKIGGEELYTKINVEKLNKKSLPENWKNKTNLSIITLNNIMESKILFENTKLGIFPYINYNCSIMK